LESNVFVTFLDCPGYLPQYAADAVPHLLLIVASVLLNLGDLLSHDHRITLCDLAGPQSLVVEAALVLVTVPVYRTEQASTTAGEPSEADFLLAGEAPAFLLLSVLVGHVLLAGTLHQTH